MTVLKLSQVRVSFKVDHFLLISSTNMENEEEEIIPQKRRKTNITGMRLQSKEQQVTLLVFIYRNL